MRKAFLPFAILATTIAATAQADNRLPHAISPFKTICEAKEGSVNVQFTTDYQRWNPAHTQLLYQAWHRHQASQSLGLSGTPPRSDPPLAEIERRFVASCGFADPFGRCDRIVVQAQAAYDWRASCQAVLYGRPPTYLAHVTYRQVSAHHKNGM